MMKVSSNEQLAAEAVEELSIKLFRYPYIHLILFLLGIESERNRRPRRAHKAPQRYGDYVDETNRDATRLNLDDIPGFEPEAEESGQGGRSRRSHSTNMRKVKSC